MSSPPSTNPISAPANSIQEDVTEFDQQGRKRKLHLAKQDLATLDPATLTPNTPEVISRQATINIGTIGLSSR